MTKYWTVREKKSLEKAIKDGVDFETLKKQYDRSEDNIQSMIDKLAVSSISNHSKIDIIRYGININKEVCIDKEICIDKELNKNKYIKNKLIEKISELNENRKVYLNSDFIKEDEIVEFLKSTLIDVSNTHKNVDIIINELLEIVNLL